MKKIKITYYNSPVGKLAIASYKDKICLSDWNDSKRCTPNICHITLKFKADMEEGTSDIICKAITELDEYFSGKRHDFSIPVLFRGTEFQCQVWTELMNIPYGTTITYSELARRIGNPRAVRAVASAVAANPISILVPCHRVIGSDGSLTGYAGGLPAKKALLSLEKLPIDTDYKMIR